MKNLFTLFLITFTLSAWAQNGVSWGNEIDVSDGSIFGNTRPRMALTSNNVPAVLYGTSSTGALYVSRWNGASFDSPVDILPQGMETYLAGWTGPDIAAKGDTVIVVFKAQPLESGNVYSVRSIDGGVTFSDTIRVDNHDNGVAWMPSLDITADGNPVVTYMVHDASWANPRYVIANSTDYGNTYNPEMEITGAIPGEACDCCPAEVVVDGSKQVMLFRNNETNVRDIYGVLSTDGGTTFPFENNIDNLGWTVNSCPSTGPHGLFVGDDLYQTSASRQTGKYRVYITRSEAITDLTYLERDTTDESSATTSSQNYPRIDGVGDTIVLAWQENQGSNADIYVSVSTNQFGTHLQALSDFGYLSNQTTASAQINPDIKYKDGLVHLCYQDLNSGNVIYRNGSIIETVGLPEYLNTDLIVTPNPSSNGQFEIYLNDKPAHIQILNSLGQAADFRSTETTKGVLIKLENSIPGLYFVELVNANGNSQINKLIVQ